MNLTQRISYLGGAFSLGIYGAFNNYTMALWLQNLGVSYILISFLGNSKSVEGTIVSPLAGMWSDRTWAGWLGRRRGASYQRSNNRRRSPSDRVLVYAIA